MSQKPEADDDDGLFYFESDHLALKSNKEYSEILKTIFILDAQRTQAIKDYDKVVELHKKALQDPVVVLEKITNGEDLGIPLMQRIAELPTIDWPSYKVDIPPEGLKFLNSNKLIEEDTVRSDVKVTESEEQKKTSIRPWTVEEQKRLEELLIIYPPEAVEFRRFKKIAAALGTRTEKQVSSRIQKYFLKLYKAGLPIPGRIPKAADRSQRIRSHPHQKYNHYLWKPTTFFPELNIPVAMNEKEEVAGPSLSGDSVPEERNYLLPTHADVYKKDLEEDKSELELQLNILQMVKKDKQEIDIHKVTEHRGFKCDYCGEEPILGSRWHCLACKIQSVDFCTDCIVSQLYSDNRHPLSHKIACIKYSDGFENASSDTSSDSGLNNVTENENNSMDTTWLSDNSDDSNEPSEEQSQEMQASDEPSTSGYVSSFVDCLANVKQEEIDIKQEQITQELDESDVQEEEEEENWNVASEQEELPVQTFEDFIRSQGENLKLVLLPDSSGNSYTLQQIDNGDNSDDQMDTPTLAYNYLHSNLSMDQ